jgi:hypothetical protein
MDGVGTTACAEGSGHNEMKSSAGSRRR